MCVCVCVSVCVCVLTSGVLKVLTLKLYLPRLK